jgi:hypothetical protein
VLSRKTRDDHHGSKRRATVKSGIRHVTLRRSKAAKKLQSLRMFDVGAGRYQEIQRDEAGSSCRCASRARVAAFAPGARPLESGKARNRAMIRFPRAQRG